MHFLNSTANDCLLACFLFVNLFVFLDQGTKAFDHFFYYIDYNQRLWTVKSTLYKTR